MKIVNTGTMYKIYGEDLKTFDTLPIGTYKVCFNKMVGFFLESSPNIKVTEKIYGVHKSKVNKIMKTFPMFERNLGVILSGNKGIGKSICAKMLAQRSIEQGLPVIIVNDYVPGIADYIGSIEQECTILFDEFDKTFKLNGYDCDGNPSGPDAQTEMLTLFDGLNQGKKLFVITCNNINRLNEFLINRPGRFHYHLRFDYPSADEIREYLRDKLDPKYYDQIEHVVSFAAKVDINYDCLRAIAFELNLGTSFKDAIGDLNIINVDSYSRYDVTLVLDDETRITSRNCTVNFYDNSDERESLRFDLNGKRYWAYFDVSKHEYDVKTGLIMVYGDDIELRAYDDETDEHIQAKASYMVFKRKTEDNLKYMI